MPYIFVLHAANSAYLNVYIYPRDKYLFYLYQLQQLRWHRPKRQLIFNRKEMHGFVFVSFVALLINIHFIIGSLFIISKLNIELFLLTARTLGYLYTLYSNAEVFNSILVAIRYSLPFRYTKERSIYASPLGQISQYYLTRLIRQ